MSKHTNIILTIVVFTFVGLIGLYVNEFTYLSNTRNIGSLVKYSLAIGLIIGSIGIFIGYRSKVLVPASGRLHLVLFVFFLAFMPFCASFSNRILSQSTPYSETYEYIGQKGYYIEILGKPEEQAADTYWIYLRKKGKEYTYRTKNSLPQSDSVGSKVRLILKKGFWGFDYFDGKSREFI